MRTGSRPGGRARLLVAAILLISVSGCGGDSSDDGGGRPVEEIGTADGAEGAADVFQAWTRAVAADHGEDACAMMTPGETRNFIDTFSTDTCAQAVTKLRGRLTEDERKGLSTAEVDVATVKVTSSGKAEIPRGAAVTSDAGQFNLPDAGVSWLVRQKGHWRIDGALGNYVGS